MVKHGSHQCGPWSLGGLLVQGCVDEATEHRLGLSPDHAFDDLTVTHDHQSGDALRVESGRRGRGVVHVDLHHLQLTGMAGREFLQDGGHHPAGATPWRPQVDQNQLVGVQGGSKVCITDVHEPRKVGLARGAARSPLGRYRDAVLGAA